MDASHQVTDYLRSNSIGFWEWNDQGKVVTWRGGATIAFRDELRQILQPQVGRGLPDLDLVVLLIAATRSSWRDESFAFLGWIQREAEVGKKLTPSELVGDLMLHLDELRAILPQSPGTGILSTLVDMVFQDTSFRTSPEMAKAVLRELAEPLGSEAVTVSAARRPDLSELLVLLWELQSGLLKLDEEALLLRNQTGLESIPETSDAELPYSEQIRGLLSELEKEPTYQGLAKLVRDLMAALARPRTIAEPDDFQVGGVSDISNRGPLDKLLLSELAHDDLTLSVRLAMNEALYLRRESPPRTPVQQRSILLDVGIRTWGIPRVFATAVAMAVGGLSDARDDVSMFRGESARLLPLDLTSRDGLVDQLAALDAELHCGSYLETFAKHVSAAENPVEPLVILSAETADDVQFQRQLAESDLLPAQLALVSRDGRLELIEQTSRGRRCVQQVTLSLDQLGVEEIKAEVDDSLPAIMRVAPFPLRLSHNVSLKKTWQVYREPTAVSADIEALSIAKDQRLMHWDQRVRNCGARQISDCIPAGELWWASCKEEAGITQAIVGTAKTYGLHLLTIDLVNQACQVLQLKTNAGVQGVCSYQGVLFAIYAHQIQVLSPKSGEVVQETSMPSYVRWAHGRFFDSAQKPFWYALSHDGVNPTFELVLDESKFALGKVVAMVEVPEIDGPIVITQDGKLFYTGEAVPKATSVSIEHVENRVAAVSMDGSKVAVQALVSSPKRFPMVGTSYRRPIVLDVRSGVVTTTSGNKHWMHEVNASDVIKPTTMMHRFMHVYLSRAGKLTLVSRKSAHFSIDVMTDRIWLRGVDPDESDKSYKNFKGCREAEDRGYTLSVATWDDGSQVFLDSRGLLHLRSSLAAIPEMTLVLTDGDLAGWTATGGAFGNSYFTGSSNRGHLAEAKRILEQFTQLL